MGQKNKCEKLCVRRTEMQKLRIADGPILGVILAVFLFACYLLYDGAGWVIDAKELTISGFLLVLCCIAVSRLKYKKVAVPILGVVVLLLGGYLYYNQNQINSGTVGILASGGMVFQPSERGFSRGAICLQPLRTPHWYESGIEVDFFAPQGNFPGDVAMRELIESGAAKKVETKDGSSDMYRVTIPQKLLGHWR